MYLNWVIWDLEKGMQEKATEVKLPGTYRKLDAGFRQRQLKPTIYAWHANSELILLYSIVRLSFLNNHVTVEKQIFDYLWLMNFHN